MKTAISVPDEVYERAERVAAEHGMNRSQFYAEAAARLADRLEANDLTARMNSALASTAQTAEDEEELQFTLAAGRAALAGDDDEW